MNSARISELLKTRPKSSFYWGLYLVPVDREEKKELGLAIAKKLAKRAVDRNRLKRMIREIIRNAQSANLGADVVVKLKKPIGSKTRGSLRKREKDLMRMQITGLI